MSFTQEIFGKKVCDIRLDLGMFSHQKKIFQIRCSWSSAGHVGDHADTSIAYFFYFVLSKMTDIFTMAVVEFFQTVKQIGVSRCSGDSFATRRHKARGRVVIVFVSISWGSCCRWIYKKLHFIHGKAQDLNALLEVVCIFIKVIDFEWIVVICASLEITIISVCV